MRRVFIPDHLLCTMQLAFCVCSDSDPAAWPDLQWTVSVGHRCRHGVWPVGLSLSNADKAAGHSSAAVYKTSVHSLVVHVYTGDAASHVTLLTVKFGNITISNVQQWSFRLICEQIGLENGIFVQHSSVLEVINFLSILNCFLLLIVVLILLKDGY